MKFDFKKSRKKKLFVCFEKDGILGILIGKNSDGENDYIMWQKPGNWNPISRPKVTKIPRGGFPDFSNISDGFTVVVRNYDSIGNYYPDPRSIPKQENQRLKQIIISQDKAIKYMDNMLTRLSTSKDTEFLRDIEKLKELRKALGDKGQYFED